MNIDHMAALVVRPLVTIRPRTKVIIGYGGNGRGETAWLTDAAADELVAGFRRKKTSTPRALYVIRCRPHRRIET